MSSCFLDLQNGFISEISYGRVNEAIELLKNAFIKGRFRTFLECLNFFQSKRRSLICKVSAQDRKLLFVSCRQCQKHRDGGICINCYNNGNHKNHDILIHSTSLATCNCGDPLCWSKDGFCKLHERKNDDDFIVDKNIENNSKIVFRLIFSNLLNASMLYPQSVTAFSDFFLLIVGLDDKLLRIAYQIHNERFYVKEIMLNIANFDPQLNQWLMKMFFVFVPISEFRLKFNYFYFRTIFFKMKKLPESISETWEKLVHITIFNVDTKYSCIEHETNFSSRYFDCLLFDILSNNIIISTHNLIFCTYLNELFKSNPDNQQIVFNNTLRFLKELTGKIIYSDGKYWANGKSFPENRIIASNIFIYSNVFLQFNIDFIYNFQYLIDLCRSNVCEQFFGDNYDIKSMNRDIIKKDILCHSIISGKAFVTIFLPFLHFLTFLIWKTTTSEPTVSQSILKLNEIKEKYIFSDELLLYGSIMPIREIVLLFLNLSLVEVNKGNNLASLSLVDRSTTIGIIIPNLCFIQLASLFLRRKEMIAELIASTIGLFDEDLIILNQNEETNNCDNYNNREKIFKLLFLFLYLVFCVFYQRFIIEKYDDLNGLLLFLSESPKTTQEIERKFNKSDNLDNTLHNLILEGKINKIGEYYKIISNEPIDVFSLDDNFSKRLKYISNQNKEEMMKIPIKENITKNGLNFHSIFETKTVYCVIYYVLNEYINENSRNENVQIAMNILYTFENESIEEEIWKYNNCNYILCSEAQTLIELRDIIESEFIKFLFQKIKYREREPRSLFDILMNIGKISQPIIEKFIKNGNFDILCETVNQNTLYNSIKDPENETMTNKQIETYKKRKKADELKIKKKFEEQNKQFINKKLDQKDKKYIEEYSRNPTSDEEEYIGCATHS